MIPALILLTGCGAALEMARLACVRVIGERRGGAAERHSQRQHERRDQQSYALAH